MKIFKFLFFSTVLLDQVSAFEKLFGGLNKNCKIFHQNFCLLAIVLSLDQCREIGYFMDKLLLTGLNLGRVFNSRSSFMWVVHLFCYEAKWPNLKLKTRRKQLFTFSPVSFRAPRLVNPRVNELRS